MPDEPMRQKAIVLLSGGIDSATCLAIAKSEGLEVFALSFNYGQRHAIELNASRAIAAAIGVADHLILELPLNTIGGSALTANLDVPKSVSVDELEKVIPITYVPARNTIFLAFATAWAEVLEAQEIFLGVNALDYSGYPDCRPEYIEAFQAMVNLATKKTSEGSMKIAIRTPLIYMTKAQIIRKGLYLGVDYGLSHSCYDPDSSGHACGFCDSCLFRKKGFMEAGVPDPTVYTQQRQNP
jgi:7-cyano-7-deazaguanine synthase